MKKNVKGAPHKEQSENMNKERKPFDKKKYRLQKYSNKYKINQWEDRRRKAILRGFYKELNRDQQQNIKKLSTFKNNQNENEEQLKKVSAFHKAKQELLRKKDEKKKHKEDALRAKAEQEEALKKYKEKRIQTYKKLSKKTKKGQPVMKDRLEMLLEKIQQQVSE